MTLDEAHDAFIDKTNGPHAAAFAATVGRFQEGLLRDRVTRDLDEAFRRAVETTMTLLPAIKLRAIERGETLHVLRRDEWAEFWAVNCEALRDEAGTERACMSLARTCELVVGGGAAERVRVCLLPSLGKAA